MRFYERNYAEQYDRRLSDEGYPGNIAENIINELAGFSSVLDIGAGTGFISLPLAENGFRVKAIEPSAAMLAILERKINGRDFDLELINESWESFGDETADAIISVHSLYPMKDPNYAISKMMRCADKSVIVIRKSVQDESVSDIIRNRFGKTRCSKIADEDIKSILKKAKISFKDSDIIQTRVSNFTDIKEEAGYYISHIGLPEENKQEISEIILSKSEKKGDGFFYNTVYKDSMIVF